mgnify:CR=1 FL=1
MDNTGKPNNIEDYLCSLHTGQWFGWSDSKNKIYANIVIHPKIQDENNDTIDNPHSKPTEQQCIDGLAALKTTFDDAQTKATSDKTNGNNKLKALGLTDDEITAITKG